MAHIVPFSIVCTEWYKLTDGMSRAKAGNEPGLRVAAGIFHTAQETR
jgi:hypothetical protein